MAKNALGQEIGSREWQLYCVTDCLVNDENSSDEELVQYWMSEIKLSEKDARTFIKERNRALCDPISFTLFPD